MNDKQKVILLLVAVCMLGMLLFPPFHYVHSGTELYWGYAFLFMPSGSALTVNTALLFAQFVVVLTIGGIAFFALKGAPAQPRAARQAPPSPVSEMEYAGLVWRTLAFTCDALLIGGCIAAITVLALRNMPLLTTGTPDGLAERIADASAVAIVLCVIVAEASPWKATPGKKLLGMIIVTDKGSPVGIVRSFLRFILTANVPPFGTGLLIVPFTKRRQSVADVLTRTVVLRPKGVTLRTVLLSQRLRYCYVSVVVCLLIAVAFWPHITATEVSPASEAELEIPEGFVLEDEWSEFPIVGEGRKRAQ